MCSGNMLTFAAGSTTSVQISLGVVANELVEGVEHIVPGLNDASVNSGSDVIAVDLNAVSVDILEQDTESFPAGLSDTVAGSRIVIDEQLYGIDWKQEKPRVLVRCWSTEYVCIQMPPGYVAESG
jgi:hypothetical protein